MRRRGALPQVPRFEADDFDTAEVTGVDADVRRFVLEMRQAGGAVLDLGDEARALCDQAVAETEGYFRRGRRVQDAWRKSRAVRRLALTPKLHEALGAAYGRRSFAFQSLNFREGTQQELHSDVIHFSCQPERFMCGVWIALEDVAAGSGPLIYYPGSHRLPPLSMRDAGVNSPAPTASDYHQVWAPRFEQQVQASGLAPKELLIPKGHAFVWAANMAHGGAAIAVPGSTRRSLVVHCYFEDGVYFTPMTSDEPAGRLSLRLPPDVRTRGWRWPSRDGRPVGLPFRTILRAIAREVRNEPFIS